MANNARTPLDLERKYDLASILGLKKNVKMNKDSITKVNTELYNFIDTTTSNIKTINIQLDGKTETWFYAGEPTLNNLPASEWNDEEKESHVGDLYYDTDTGHAFRFAIQDKTYLWLKITDSDVTEALELASMAQDTADNKRRVFIAQPIPPYDKGDLYIKDEELFICNISKETGSYTEGDFIIATKYTDDSKANEAIDNLNNFVDKTFAETISNLTNQIDGKTETWFYAGEPTLNNLPASEWNDEEKLLHTGDIYYDKTTGYTYIFEYVDSVFKWTRVKDEDIVQAMSLANSAQDTADNKRQIFIVEPTTPYSCGDLWITANEIYICQIERLTGAFNSGDWINNLKYTDNTYAKAIVDELGGTTTEVLEGTVTQYTKSWVKFTDLATGGSTIINGSNIKTGNISTDHISIGNENVTLDKDGLKLKNGAKVVGENGLMNTYIFTQSYDNTEVSVDGFAFCGCDAEGGLDGWSNSFTSIRDDIGIIANIPEGLNITSAKVILCHAPMCWEDSVNNPGDYIWGYCRNLKLYKATNINNRVFAGAIGSDLISVDNTSYSEINGALGSNGWTPSEPNSSSHNTEMKISEDIKSSLTTGINKILIRTGEDVVGYTMPAATICERRALIYAILKIDGYMSYS